MSKEPKALNLARTLNFFNLVEVQKLMLLAHLESLGVGDPLTFVAQHSIDFACTMKPDQGFIISIYSVTPKNAEVASNG